MIQSIFLFLRRGLQIRRNFSTTCTTLGTRGEKLQVDAALCGRSMVEMLGVLAIIGVLSVGAIAGYSKAMEKYKVNKIVQNHSYFIARLAEYENLKEKDGNLAPYLSKLSLFPDNFTILSDGATIESNGLTFRPFVRSRFVIDYYLSAVNPSSNQTFNVKLCTSLILNLAIPLHDSIYMVWLYRGEGNPYGSSFYGDSECTETRTCLKDVALNNVYSLCNECVAGSDCTLTFELF